MRSWCLRMTVHSGWWWLMVAEVLLITGAVGIEFVLPFGGDVRATRKVGPLLQQENHEMVGLHMVTAGDQRALQHAGELLAAYHRWLYLHHCCSMVLAFLVLFATCIGCHPPWTATNDGHKRVNSSCCWFSRVYHPMINPLIIHLTWFLAIINHVYQLITINQPLSTWLVCWWNYV